MIDAIRRLAVRGAPAIGVAGAFAVALAAQQAEREGLRRRLVRAEAERIAAARPTAVNLSWAVRRVRRPARRGRRRGRRRGGRALRGGRARPTGRSPRAAPTCWRSCCGTALRVHTHCNTGGLACVEWGTALGHRAGAARARARWRR